MPFRFSGVTVVLHDYNSSQSTHYSISVKKSFIPNCPIVSSKRHGCSHLHILLISPAPPHFSFINSLFLFRWRLSQPPPSTIFSFSASKKSLTVVSAAKKAVDVLKGNSDVEAVVALTQEDTCPFSILLFSLCIIRSHWLCYMAMGNGSGSSSSAFFLPKLGVKSPSVEVYMAGCCGGVPVILTKTIQTSPRRKVARHVTLDAIPEDEEIDKEQQDIITTGDEFSMKQKVQIMESEVDEYDESEMKMGQRYYPEGMYVDEDGQVFVYVIASV